MISPAGSYYIVGTWADVNELMALADRDVVHLATVEYALKDAQS